MRKILVGFDGSEGSEQALNRAIMLIDEFGELILVGVIPSPSDKKFVDDEIYRVLKDKANNLISDAIKDLGQQSYSLKGIVEEGDPAARIIDVSNKLNVDLIVLGSRGTSELGQFLLGSVANKVVQYAHKPVMVVR
jgi:nucleotide-binding universal stress UspA family protein